MSGDDDVTVEPDPVVRTALQLLPVPAHGDDFWADLDRALAVTAGPAAPPIEGATTSPSGAASGDAEPPAAFELHPDPALGVVPPALRRRSNAVVAAAAVAAAVLVVVAGTTLIRERSTSDVDTSEQAVTAPQGSSPASLTSTTLRTAPSVSGEDGELSSQAVLSWVAALGESDGDAAWGAMGPGSKRHLGTRAAFDDMMSGLSEGYGAWSAAEPDQVLLTPIPTEGDATVVIVTLVGDVEQEGTMQRRADAFAVRLVDGVAELEPFDVAGEVEVVVPDETAGPTQTVEDDELVIVVPQGAEAPTVRLDDGEAVVCGDAPGTELTDLEGAPGRRCSFSPAGGIPPGSRVLTVAFSTGDGGDISAESVLFQAA